MCRGGWTLSFARLLGVTRVGNVTVTSWQRKTSYSNTGLGWFVFWTENKDLATSVIIMQNCYIWHVDWHMHSAPCLHRSCYHAPCTKMTPPKAKRTHELVINRGRGFDTSNNDVRDGPNTPSYSDGPWCPEFFFEKITEIFVIEPSPWSSSHSVRYDFQTSA